MKVVFVFFSTLFWSFLLHAESLPQLEVESYTLDNGMKVLLHHDDALPMYSLHIWYDVGSKDEEPHMTGLAHFFEHLMFKGTKKYKEGVYDDLIEKFGGQNNAFTTRDYTGYFVEMPSGTLKKILELEADRMIHLEISEEKISREREVVKEERRMRVDNNPGGLAFEKVVWESYDQSSYKWPVIGSMDHLNSARVTDFSKFYKNFYSPSNATLVLVGSFNPKRAKTWIKKYFASLPQTTVKRPSRKNQNIYKNHSRTIKIQKEVHAPLVTVAFPTFSGQSRKALALDVASAALSQGKDSILYEDFIEKKKSLIGIDTWNYTPRYEGLLFIFAQVKPGQSRVKFTRDLKAKLKKIAKTGLSRKQMEAAKKKLLLSVLPTFQTQSGKARALAYGETVSGDHRKMFKDLEAYQNLSLSEVNQALREALDFEKMKTVEVHP